VSSPVYYAILIALLAALIIVLVLLIRKRKRENENIKRYMEQMEKLRAERRAEGEKKKTHYSTYNEAEQPVTKWRHGRTYVDDNRQAPKYAAGDDMDSLRRERNAEETSYTPFILSAVALICAIAIFTGSQNGIKLPSISTENTAEKLNVDITSATYINQNTSILVALKFKNESINTCYNIVTTVNLTVENEVINSEKHTIAAIPGGIEKNETISIAIPEEYQDDSITVNFKSKYSWKNT